jgi:dTDP-4-amino-4,6-dideoxygalactose transaminase
LGIGPGDEVIVPAMTFIASAEPVALLGARPVFVDIDPQTYTLDPQKVATRINSRTKALIVVHLYGQPANVDALLEMAEHHKIALIEDMAQALGSAWRGKKVGGFGKIACLSFYPTKNLGAIGDAGMILTSDLALAGHARRLRNHGAALKYEHDEAGYNSRLDELQAAILRVKLPWLDRWNRSRIQGATEYNRLLQGLPITLPYAAPLAKHIYHLYTICTPRRDALAAYLQDQGIHSAVHYPKPLHLQKAFQSLGGRIGEFPCAERLSRETLSLPLHPHMTSQDIKRVAQAVKEFYKKEPSR